MGPKLSLALILPFATFLGCGTGTTPASSTPSYINVTGNWTVGIATEAVPVPVVGSISGSLTSSGSSVTGVLRAYPLTFPNCVAETTDLPASGTLDTQGNLTLTFPIAGGTGSLSGNFTETTDRPILSGTYQVTGGLCAQSAIAVSFYQLLNLTGTFSGTVNTGTGMPNSTVTAVLVQSATPDSDGIYSLSGTITSVGPCTWTLTFAQGQVFGDEAQSFPFPPDPVPYDSFVAELPAYNAQFIPIAGLFQPTGCAAGAYWGNLTRQ